MLSHIKTAGNEGPCVFDHPKSAISHKVSRNLDETPQIENLITSNDHRPMPQDAHSKAADKTRPVCPAHYEENLYARGLGA